MVLSGVTPHRDERRALRTLVDDRCEGLLLVGSELPARELAELAAQVPLVVMARRVRGVDAVRSDDVGGAVLGMDHLIGLGHDGFSTSTVVGQLGPPSVTAATGARRRRRSCPN